MRKLELLDVDLETYNLMKVFKDPYSYYLPKVQKEEVKSKSEHIK